MSEIAAPDGSSTLNFSGRLPLPALIALAPLFTGNPKVLMPY